MSASRVGTLSSPFFSIPWLNVTRFNAWSGWCQQVKIWVRFDHSSLNFSYENILCEAWIDLCQQVERVYCHHFFFHFYYWTLLARFKAWSGWCQQVEIWVRFDHSSNSSSVAHSSLILTLLLVFLSNAIPLLQWLASSVSRNACAGHITYKLIIQLNVFLHFRFGILI